MPVGNGGIIGVVNTPTLSSASGVWSLQEQELARKAGIWPDQFSSAALALDFDETTTLDSRITFTRATSATYFDSSGVLQTASSGVARFDHRLEGGVWVNKGLLIEEQRTNICLRSEEFDTTWSTEQTSVTANSSTAPDGNTTADSLIEDTSTSVHSIFQASLTIVAGSFVSASVYIKALGSGSTRYPRLQLNNTAGTTGLRGLFDVSNGTKVAPVTFGTGSSVSSTITDVGNGWYRCTLSGIIDVSTTSIRFFVFMQNQGTSYTASYTGDNASGLLFWGAQVEAGAFPTSYIKTTTASVTRNRDVAEMTSTDFSDWYNATEGTIFTQYSVNAASINQRSFEISDGTANERIIGVITASGGDGGSINIIDGGVTQATLGIANGNITPVVNQTYKLAGAYQVDNFAGSRDGGSVNTDTSGTLPVVNQINIGSAFNDGGQTNGHIAKFYYWNTRKSNAFLQGVTS